jgi:hypothetical protein
VLTIFQRLDRCGEKKIILHNAETIYKPIRNRKYVLTIFQRLDRCGEKTMRNTSGYLQGFIG